MQILFVFLIENNKKEQKKEESPLGDSSV